MKNTILFLLLSSGIFCMQSCKNKAVPSSDLIHDVDVSQFTELIASEKGQLIDVRTSEEYAAGHIENAVNIDFYNENFQQMLKSALDSDKPVYVYCRSGGRSGKTAKLMIEEMKYEQPVYNLLGGYTDWSKEK